MLMSSLMLIGPQFRKQKLRRRWEERKEKKKKKIKEREKERQAEKRQCPSQFLCSEADLGRSQTSGSSAVWGDGWA